MFGDGVRSLVEDYSEPFFPGNQEDIASAVG